MKKKIIFGALIFVLGLFIAIGPFTIFHVCKPDQSEMYMKCYWTARAELGIGIVISILGLLSAISASAKTRIGLNISVVLNGIAAFLIPSFLIGVCDGKHMHCHAVALPALSILSAVVFALAVINIIYTYRNGEKSKNEGIRIN